MKNKYSYKNVSMEADADTFWTAQLPIMSPQVALHVLDTPGHLSEDS